MASEPAVSVVIPYGPEFTPEAMLANAKDSARSQEVPVELVVVEDVESRGPSWARNRGIERTTTRYVAFLDADDRWYDGKLRRQLEWMKATDAGLCVEGVDMDTESFIRELYLGNLESLTSSILVDTDRVDVTFDETLDRREDHLFMLEAASQGGVCLCPDLFEVGRHDDSYSSGTSHAYRLGKDREFAAEVRTRVPEVREYVNRYYSTVRCRVEPVRNTPGDLFRLWLIRARPSAFLFMVSSLLCQYLTDLVDGVE